MTCDDCKENTQRLIDAQQRLIVEQSITINRLRKRLDVIENPPVRPVRINSMADFHKAFPQGE